MKASAKKLFLFTASAAMLFVFLTLSVFFGAVKAERLPVRVYTSADGLGSSYVNYLMRDSHGFLWFATRDGLSRFDGSRFITYQVGGKDSPPGVEQIIESRSGVYWIMTTGGLYRFDPNKINENQMPNSDSDRPMLNAEFVSDRRGVLHEDFSGSLWLADSSFYRIVEREDRTISLEETRLDLPPNPSVAFVITALASSRDKSLWAATTWGFLRLLPDGRKVFYPIKGIPAATSKSIIEDSAGRIWIARVSDFFVIKPETPDELKDFGDLTVRRIEDTPEKAAAAAGAVVLPERPGEIFRYADFKDFAGVGTAKFLCETSDKHVWISAGFGAIEFDGQAFKSHTTEQGLLKNGGRMIEDAAGNLWFGWSTGIVRLDRSGLTTYDERVLAIGETRSGALYTGDGQFTVGRFDGAGFQNARPALPPETIAGWMSRPVFQDSAGEWWFLTGEGLYRFAATEDLNALARQKPLAVYGQKDGFNGDAMFQIFEDSAKNLWISTRGTKASTFGLARWTRATGEFKFFTEADGFPPNKSASTFAEDERGNIWLGFYDGNLARFSGERFKVFSTPETNGVITALHIDQRQNNLWIATSMNGVSRVENLAADELVFTSYTTANGLTSNNVRSLTEDEFGRIYAGTARGVDRIAPDTGRITHYTVSDGLAGDFVTIAYRARDGALWFGTPNGLSRLVPRRESEAISPPVRLSGLRVAGESRKLPELGTSEISTLELQPGQNNLQVDFFGMDFSPNGALRYQYKLEGADKDWSAPTEQRSVTYANLSAGDYRFLVRAIGADGSESPQPATFSFKILRPVWQRWWFLLAAVFLISLTIYALYRYRVAQLLKFERVRTRIATDLHDDIGASLSKIAILSEVVNHQIAPMVGKNAEIEKSLGEISGTSREMVDSMSDIVWAINPQRDSLSDLTGRMRNLASEMTELADIGLKFHASGLEAESDLPLGADLRRDIYLIFKETINNLVKHSGGERVEVEFRVDGGEFVFIVKDDGTGFDVSANGNGAARRGGNGLINMRRRAENLGGEYKIESAAGGGTTATLRVPLKNKLCGFGLKRFRFR
jgi:signal transduction histidine kinase/ligand-binding sensor domain-containing protein